MYLHHAGVVTLRNNLCVISIQDHDCVPDTRVLYLVVGFLVGEYSTGVLNRDVFSARVTLVPIVEQLVFIGRLAISACLADGPS